MSSGKCRPFCHGFNVLIKQRVRNTCLRHSVLTRYKTHAVVVCAKFVCGQFDTSETGIWLTPLLISSDQRGTVPGVQRLARRAIYALQFKEKKNRCNMCTYVKDIFIAVGKFFRLSVAIWECVYALFYPQNMFWSYLCLFHCNDVIMAVMAS